VSLSYDEMPSGSTGKPKRKPHDRRRFGLIVSELTLLSDFNRSHVCDCFLVAFLEGRLGVD